jgi:putative ABC transport system permease protein
MFILIQVFVESLRQAVQQLWGNKLRTFLSLLGVTIGIWCVIMVFSAVDSLEDSIKQSFQELGDDVVYVNTMPWGEDPRENLWKYERRPEPNYADYMAIRERVRTASLVSFAVFMGPSTVDYVRGDVGNVFLMGITEDYRDMFNLQFEEGRYFSPTEFYRGTNQVIIGHNVRNALFLPTEIAIGKMIKIRGQRMQVVGVLKKEGKDLLNPINFDQAAIIPYVTSAKFLNLNASRAVKGRSSIAVKAAAGLTLDALKNELTAVIRAHRRLRPSEETNFELNTLSILSGILENIFIVIRAAGFLIGIFSIIVGGFSVANIMFVSVKERTNLIGVKKALGAKQYVILMEFLIESIILCLIGGAFGLIFVYLAAVAATAVFEFNIFLSLSNIIFGLSISTLTGVISGFIPAYMASRLDPVEAMRA